MERFEYQAASLADTDRLAAAVAASVPDGTVIVLRGTLGAGKTRFVKGLAAACGIPPDEVISPTFVLCQEYHGRRTILHCDAYRLRDEREFEQLGAEEFFQQEAIIVIEWGERVAAALPGDRIEIAIAPSGEAGTLDEESRTFTLTALGPASRDVLERIVKETAMGGS